MLPIPTSTALAFLADAGWMLAAALGGEALWCRALHHCRISLSGIEQIVYFGLALLQAITSDATPRVTNSDGSVTDSTRARKAG